MTGKDDKGLLAIGQQAQGEGDDGLRRLVGRVVQQVFAAGDQAVFLRASPYERTSGRRGYRNGYPVRRN